MSHVWPDTPSATWTMVAAIVGFMALVAAIWYARTTARMFQRDHRPMVRVVYSKAPKAVLLKNMGLGTAFGAVLCHKSGRQLSKRAADAVEPLGAGESESKRIGRTAHELLEQPQVGETYWLHYQDITGGWHRTVATLGKERYVVGFRIIKWGVRMRVPRNVFANRLIRR